METPISHISAILRLSKTLTEYSQTHGLESMCLNPAKVHISKEIERLTLELEEAIKRGEVKLSQILYLVKHADE